MLLNVEVWCCWYKSPLLDRTLSQFSSKCLLSKLSLFAHIFFQSRWRILISKFHTFFHCPLSIKMLWTDPNEIPSMLATLWIVILLFLMTTAFSWSTVLCVLLVDVHPECAVFSTVIAPLLNWENQSENCIIPIIIWSPKFTINIL